MDLTWLDIDNLDGCDAAGVVAVYEAARAVDSPQLPPSSLTTFVADLKYGWDGDPPAVAVVHDGRRVVGVLEVGLPSWDNTHLGELIVTVDPLARRRGLGRLLLDTGMERVRAAGRSVVLAESIEESAGTPFLDAMGFERAAVGVARRQDPAALDWSRLDQLYTEAESRSGGYELVRLAGRTPDDLLADIVRVVESINDAPTDDLDVEDEKFPPERIVAMDAAQLARGRRIYRLVARRRDGGELAGHTVVAVETDRPWLGWQLDTSVARDHRGHRLGRLLKIGMLHWLRAQEPQLRDLVTWNAASNDHMIRVNDALGYAVVTRNIDWQRRL